MSVHLIPGRAPLVVSMPHIGTRMPPALTTALVPRARDVEDTDWHLERLYNFLDEMGATVVRATVSRYIIDLNRPPDDTPMYPGAANTELCPTRFFTGEPLYRDGQSLTPEQREERRARYWQPYHNALARELERLRKQHGFVVLWDAHSIRSELPWLFEGTLPDLNIGTAGGTSCDPRVEQAVANACGRHFQYTHAVNGRFKGGYITRHYGKPTEGIHAIQLEMAQKLYMRETLPFDYQEVKARDIQPVLRDLVTSALNAAKAIHGK